MSGCTLSQETIQQVIDFHGHWCPGLAIGIRAGEYVTEKMGRAADEEIVTVVETDMCGVDAIQVLTGCTFGKGNLIYRDLGKMAFSFHRRADGFGVRLVFNREMLDGQVDGFTDLTTRWLKGQLNQEEIAQLMQMREERAKRIMESPLEEVFTVKEPDIPLPQRARILESLTCAQCGESVMESRTRRLEGKTLCIPCFDAQERRA